MDAARVRALTFGRLQRASAMSRSAPDLLAIGGTNGQFNVLDGQEMSSGRPAVQMGPTEEVIDADFNDGSRQVRRRPARACPTRQSLMTVRTGPRRHSKAPARVLDLGPLARRRPTAAADHREANLQEAAQLRFSRRQVSWLRPSSSSKPDNTLQGSVEAPPAARCSP